MATAKVLLIPRIRAWARDLTAASTQYFDIGTGPFPGTSNFSIGGWVYLDAIAEGSLISTGGVGTSVGFRLRVAASGRLRGDLCDSALNQLTTGDSGTVLATGTWYHAAMVVTAGTTITLYLNGAQGISASAASIGAINSAALKRIGATPTALIDGRISRVFYAESALTTDDLAELQPRPRKYAQLSVALKAKMTHFWNLDESGTAVDAVAANNATEVNGPIPRVTGP